MEQDHGARHDAKRADLRTLLTLPAPPRQIGYGTEETNFALELTYNYGISSYEKGNDLRCVCAPVRLLTLFVFGC